MTKLSVILPHDSIKFRMHEKLSSRKSVDCILFSKLIIVQRYATQSSLLIVLWVHSTCFGCQPHQSSGVHKTVTTASGTGQLPPSNVAKLAWPRWREVAAQKIWSVPGAVVAVFALLMMGVVDTRNTLERGSCTENMTSTGGCSYSFVYSWWWLWLTPETCRVNLQNNTECPTRYRTRHFFNNFTTNEDNEQEYVRCVRNEEECVCSVCL